MIRQPGRGRGAFILAVAAGLMVASLLRFRVHCWLVTLPVFLLLGLILWYRSRQVTWLVSGATAIVASGLLYAEMSLPVYMPGTTELHFGFNGLSNVPFYRVWPLSADLDGMLHHWLSGAWLKWTWQVVCLAGFAVWDILGIPLCLVLALVPLVMKRSRAMTYYWFTIGILLLSWLFATCLTMGYDGYSVPGQLLYHLGWYALPLEGIGIAWLVSYLQRRTKYASMIVAAFAVICAIASGMTQRRHLPGPTATGMPITPAAWAAFHYLKEQTPEEAVVLSSSPLDRAVFAVSGLGGRSAYLEAPGNPVDAQALKLNPGDNRSQKLAAMETAQDATGVCSVLTGTPITHILEQASSRLMPNLPCLKRLWTARDGVTTVWQVVQH